jgi:hypothetical protein
MCPWREEEITMGQKELHRWHLVKMADVGINQDIDYPE